MVLLVRPKAEQLNSYYRTFQLKHRIKCDSQLKDSQWQVKCCVNAIFIFHIFLKRMPQSEVDHFQVLTFIEHFQTLRRDFSTAIKVNRPKAFKLVCNHFQRLVGELGALSYVECVETGQVLGDFGDAGISDLTSGERQTPQL